jgi:hypothetical protein
MQQCPENQQCKASVIENSTLGLKDAQLRSAVSFSLFPDCVNKNPKIFITCGLHKSNTEMERRKACPRNIALNRARRSVRLPS